MSSAVAAPVSTQVDRNARGPVGTWSGLSTIRARLYIALGFMAATTVGCSLLALYGFTNIGGAPAHNDVHRTPGGGPAPVLVPEAKRRFVGAPGGVTGGVAVCDAERAGRK